MWQDIVIMAGGIILGLALIPAIRDGQKPPTSTSLFTGSVLATFTICYATLGMWAATGATLFTTALWFVLMFQRLLQRRG